MSHVTKDKVFISEIKDHLLAYGIQGFVAHEDIEPTKEWLDEIINALDSCDALAAFITPDYHSSYWTDQEVGYAIRRRVLIAPIGLGQTPYGFMGRYQGAQCKDKEASVVAEIIFEMMLKNDKTKARMAEALVGNLELADSFDAAANASRLLNRVETWTPELLRGIQEASERNSQVAGSYVAMPRIKVILENNTF